MKILAELNAVPRSVIEEILTSHGCDLEKKLPKTIRAKKEEEKKVNGNSWTSEEVAFMLERRKQGVDVRHIAAEMGRSVPAINSKLKKLREEGKKIAAEIEAEEREETAVPKGTQTEVQKSDSLLDKIMRLVQDYEKAAELAGEADEIHIDATAESVVLRGSGNVVFYIKETIITI